MEHVQSMLFLSSSLLLAGCDGVFGLQHVHERPDAGGDRFEPATDAQRGTTDAAACTIDRFDGAALSRWTRYVEKDHDIVVDVEQLVAKVGSAGAGYAWVHSTQPVRMIGATATVDVARAITGPNTETYFSLYINEENLYYFSVYGGRLYMELRHNGNEIYSDVAYTPTAHRFWRFSHDVAFAKIHFHTSPNNQDWTEHFATSTSLPIGDMLIELGVGADGFPTQGDARFDNFELCVP
jgi:hypothetical protein